MPSWVLIAIGITVVMFVILLIVLRIKGWKLSEISVWPPNAKMMPPGPTKEAIFSDTFLADSESELGKIDLKGAGDTTNVTARNKSKIGDVTIERTRKQ